VDELAKHLGVDELAIGCFKLKHFADVPKHLPTLKHVTGVLSLKTQSFHLWQEHCHIYYCTSNYVLYSIFTQHKTS
jgi:hypothetical protein